MPQRKWSSEQIAALQKVYWRAADAQEILDLWRRSGMTLTAFARAHGLCRHRLVRWRDHLGSGAAHPRIPSSGYVSQEFGRSQSSPGRESRSSS